jgi:hypothetical protein
MRAEWSRRCFPCSLTALTSDSLSGRASRHRVCINSGLCFRQSAGVAKIEVLGGAQREYQANVDPARLDSYGLAERRRQIALGRQCDRGGGSHGRSLQALSCHERYRFLSIRSRFVRRFFVRVRAGLFDWGTSPASAKVPRRSGPASRPTAMTR